VGSTPEDKPLPPTTIRDGLLLDDADHTTDYL
jgi:hypothetical protein